MAQMARCSYDIHVQEIFGSIMNGATLVMLRPRGTIDIEYLCKVLETKQITYLHTVPTLLYQLFIFINKFSLWKTVEHLRSICSSGRYTFADK